MSAPTLRMARTAAAVVSLALGGCTGGSGGSTTDVEGTWGSTTQSSPNLTFAPDGTVTGTDGCNRLTGSWSVDGDVVRIERLASTEMYCEGVDTWLSNASHVALEGTSLRVSDANGSRIGTLERSTT